MDTKTFFKNRPTAKEVFQTSDNYLFAIEADAKSHANTLKDKNVKKIAKPATNVAVATATPAKK